MKNRGRPTKITEDIKTQILFYSYVLKLSTRAIGKELKLNHNTVASFLREYKGTSNVNQESTILES